MGDIVKFEQGELWAESPIIARKLGMKHGELVSAIKNVLRDYGDLEDDVKQYQDHYRGTDFTAYHMSPKFLLLLVSRRRKGGTDVIKDFIEAIPEAMQSSVLAIIESMDVQDLPPDRYVYVAKEKHSGRYKVGISKHPHQRVAELNIGNPEVLDLVHCYKATESGYLSETLAHKALCGTHLRSEWFDETTDLTLLPVNEENIND